MGDSTRNSSVRTLAAVSLAAFIVLVVIVFAVSFSGGDGGGSADKQTTTVKHSKRRYYTIKDGDTLNKISVKTGVEIAQLEALNPDLDPQALIAGQRIKLR